MVAVPASHAPKVFLWLRYSTGTMYVDAGTGRPWVWRLAEWQSSRMLKAVLVDGIMATNCTEYS